MGKKISRARSPVFAVVLATALIAGFSGTYRYSEVYASESESEMALPDEIVPAGPAVEGNAVVIFESGVNKLYKADANGNKAVEGEEITAEGAKEISNLFVGSTATGIPEGIALPKMTTLDMSRGAEVKEILSNQFKGMSGLETIRLPIKTTFAGGFSIGNGAFSGTGITQIRIPESVARVGASAFDACSQLKGAVFEGITPPAMDADAFTNCANMSYIAVPDSAVDAYKTVAGLSSYTEKIASSTATIADGGNQTWTKGSSDYLIVTGSVPCNEFEDVLVDDVSVPSDQYIVESGSTIVKLKPEYLNTLPAGRRKLTLKWSYTSVTTYFEINAPASAGPEVPVETTPGTKPGTTTTVKPGATTGATSGATGTGSRQAPKTGDSDSVILLLVLMGLGVCGLYAGKNKHFLPNC